MQGKNALECNNISTIRKHLGFVVLNFTQDIPHRSRQCTHYTSPFRNDCSNHSCTVKRRTHCCAIRGLSVQLQITEAVTCGSVLLPSAFAQFRKHQGPLSTVNTRARHELTMHQAIQRYGAGGSPQELSCLSQGMQYACVHVFLEVLLYTMYRVSTRIYLAKFTNLIYDFFLNL